MPAKGRSRTHQGEESAAAARRSSAGAEGRARHQDARRRQSDPHGEYPGGLPELRLPPVAMGGQGGQLRRQCQPKQEGIQETTLDEEGREFKKTAGEQSQSCLSATLGGCQRGLLQAGQRVRGEAEERGLAKEEASAPVDDEKRGHGSAVQGPAGGKRSWPLEELKLAGRQCTGGERECTLLKAFAGSSPFRQINCGGAQSRIKEEGERCEWAQLAEYYESCEKIGQKQIFSPLPRGV